MLAEGLYQDGGWGSWELWLLKTSWLVIVMLTSVDWLVGLGVNSMLGLSLGHLHRGCPASGICCWGRCGGRVGRYWAAQLLLLWSGQV
jgi:hypothetical protein